MIVFSRLFWFPTHSRCELGTSPKQLRNFVSRFCARPQPLTLPGSPRPIIQNVIVNPSPEQTGVSMQNHGSFLVSGDSACHKVRSSRTHCRPNSWRSSRTRTCIGVSAQRKGNIALWPAWQKLHFAVAQAGCRSHPTVTRRVQLKKLQVTDAL